MIAQGKCQWRSGGPMLGRTYAFPHHRPRVRRLAALAAAVLALAWWLGRRNHEPAAP